jgi:DNA-binding NarL/FixJ family response regulator
MPLKILLAEDSEIMSNCIIRFLKEESKFHVVGVAVNFGQAMQMRSDFKPDILLMDLHLPQKRDFTAEFVKSQICSVPMLAISASDDEEAKALAESYGALMLLDKMNLYDELIPAIKEVCQNTHLAKAADSFDWASPDKQEM